jgi:hypothetical protein
VRERGEGDRGDEGGSEGGTSETHKFNIIISLPCGKNEFL